MKNLDETMSIKPDKDIVDACFRILEDGLCTTKMKKMALEVLKHETKGDGVLPNNQ